MRFRQSAVPVRVLRPGGTSREDVTSMDEPQPLEGTRRLHSAPIRDEDWYEQLFHAHARSVYKYLARRAPQSDVDDLAADVLATAWRRRHDVPEGAELPWLYKTASYVLANHRRKHRPVPVEEIWESVDHVDPADRAVADDEARRALETLSPRDRQILLLHAWDGLDGAALAALLGISRGGADAALSRARARLSAAWSPGA